MNNKITINGKIYNSIKEACEDKSLNKHGIKLQTIRYRIRAKWDMNEVFNKERKHIGINKYSKPIEIKDSDYICSIKLWRKQYKNISDIAYTFGIDPNMLKRNIHKGLSIEKSVLDALKRGVDINQIHYKSLIDACSYYHIQSSLVNIRLYRGYSLKEALTKDIKKHSLKKKIVFRGMEYESYIDICRKYNIQWDNVHSTKRSIGNSVNILDVIEIYIKIKELLPVGTDYLLARIPYCVINNVIYKTRLDFCKQFDIPIDVFDHCHDMYNSKYKNSNNLIMFLLYLKTQNGYWIDSNIKEKIPDINIEKSIDTLSMFNQFIKKIKNDTKL
jgi:hypothetical protein